MSPDLIRRHSSGVWVRRRIRPERNRSGRCCYAKVVYSPAFPVLPRYFAWSFSRASRNSSYVMGGGTMR